MWYQLAVMKPSTVSTVPIVIRERLDEIRFDSMSHYMDKLC